MPTESVRDDTCVPRWEHLAEVGDQAIADRIEDGFHGKELHRLDVAG